MKPFFFSQPVASLFARFGTSTMTKIFRHYYKNTHFTLENTTAKELQIKQTQLELLLSEYSFELPLVHTVHESPDETVKFLMQFSDGQKVETVLIPFYKRYTLCLSTQVGCGMKCSFCYTGTQGLKRHLEAHEIVGQYIQAWRWLKNNRKSKTIAPNIVFMGQGEPLHNFDSVKWATEIFLEKDTFHIGPRQITLSTAGYLPGLTRFHEFPQINLAISFHSPVNETRNELIPLNKTYPIEKLLEAIDQVPLMKRQYITFEYLMIKNLNMHESDVKSLHHLLKSRKAILNLIPFNPFPGSHYLRPEPAEIDHFKEQLVKNGIHVMVRTTKGDEILAACGQLKTGGK